MICDRQGCTDSALSESEERKPFVLPNTMRVRLCSVHGRAFDKEKYEPSCWFAGDYWPAIDHEFQEYMINDGRDACAMPECGFPKSAHVRQ